MNFQDVETLPESDDRPKMGGWAPGEYLHVSCKECGTEFVGDKYAYECADCAYSKVLFTADQLDSK